MNAIAEQQTASTASTTLRGQVIGVVGPITLDDFRAYLPKEIFDGDYPKGLGGSPVGLLCCELLRRGHHLIVFSLDSSVKTERIFEGRQLKICFGPYTQRRARKFFRAEIRYLTNAILREKPSFLHAHWTYEFALASIASGLPYVVTAHDAPLNVVRRNLIPYRIVRTLMAYRACRNAQRLVAVSPYVADHLKRFGFHAKPIDIVPNGMPDSLFLRAHPKEPKGSITFATVLTGWSKFKNSTVAIKAFAKVRNALPNSRLLMFGDGHGPDEIARDWAIRHGYEKGIEFIGLVPYQKLIETLSRTVDILVHPSLEEAHPMSVVEAMSMGIPVIGGRASGGVPWTLGDGQYGLLVDVRSPDKVAEAMLRLAEDEPERARLGMAGYEAARTRFHIEQVVDRYEAIYAELAPRPLPNRGEEF